MLMEHGHTLFEQSHLEDNLQEIVLKLQINQALRQLKINLTQFFDFFEPS